MSDLQRLIIGYIPKGCSSDYIIPGDPDHLKGTSEEEEERIYDNAMYELEDWVEIKSTVKINCSCEFTAL